MYRAHIMSASFPFDLVDNDIQKMLKRNNIAVSRDKIYHFLYGDFKDLVSCIALMYNDNIVLAKSIISTIQEISFIQE